MQVQDVIRASEERYMRYAETARTQLLKAISRHGPLLTGTDLFHM